MGLLLFWKDWEIWEYVWIVEKALTVKQSKYEVEQSAAAWRRDRIEQDAILQHVANGLLNETLVRL